MTVTQFVDLHRGCLYHLDEDFVKGERSVRCRHGRTFIVKATTPVTVNYTVVETTPKPKEES